MHLEKIYIYRETNKWIQYCYIIPNEKKEKILNDTINIKKKEKILNNINSTINNIELLVFVSTQNEISFKLNNLKNLYFTYFNLPIEFNINEIKLTLKQNKYISVVLYNNKQYLIKKKDVNWNEWLYYKKKNEIIHLIREKILNWMKFRNFECIKRESQ